MAFDKIEPLPDPWRQHARLCSWIAATKGVNVPEDDLMPAYVEAPKEEPKRLRRRQSEQQMEANLRAIFGNNVIEPGSPT